MTHSQAIRLQREFYEKTNPSEDDIFLFTEAMEYLIDTTHDPRYMLELGGEYYELRRFDLAKKYYEMAAEYNETEAFVCLGYIYYYGRTGAPDYQKAFENYSRAMEAGHIVSAYKVADMYKNGYYVEKSYENYKRIIEDLYPQVRDCRSLGDPVPEIFTRLAGIREKEGRTQEAVRLLWNARSFLSQRIRYNPFFGNLTIMKYLIRDLWRLDEDMDEDDISLYDLYHVLEKPGKVTFRWKDGTHEAEALLEDGEPVYRFDGQWFRTLDDFFAKAAIEGTLLTTLWNELYLFELC